VTSCPAAILDRCYAITVSLSFDTVVELHEAGGSSQPGSGAILLLLLWTSYEMPSKKLRRYGTQQHLRALPTLKAA
jgi:hypothetical protein